VWVVDVLVIDVFVSFVVADVFSCGRNVVDVVKSLVADDSLDVGDNDGVESSLQ
jgi:hypothetical protein